MNTRDKIFYYFIFLWFPYGLLSTPDLTIIGYIIPEDGLGKIPITIVETLGNEFSVNIRYSRTLPDENKLPSSMVAALHNPDQVTGKIAMSTVGLWHRDGINRINMPNDCLIKIAYSMFETTKIPTMWVKILNEEFDAVVVPDKFLMKVYEECGVQIPIFILPIPMMLDPYFSHSLNRNTHSKPFIFGDASANKNPTALIKGFAKAFGNDPSIKLIMRACEIRPETREVFNRLVNRYHLTNVTLEEGDLSLDQYIDFLSSLDCYVNLSKGEGFSLIPREALAMGIPVIISDNTASSSICKSGYVRAVPSKIRTSPLGHYEWLFQEKCGSQFDCNTKDVTLALLDVYNNHEEYRNKAYLGREWVDQYNCKNEKLRGLYRTLIRPKEIVLGNANKIEQGVIMTNSSLLKEKYLQVINEER